jgi:hypothetical protein
MGLEALRQRGWTKFGQDAAISDWVAHVQPIAAQIASDPKHIASWLRYGGTWFAGVNVLPNDPRGRLNGGPVLAGPAVELLTTLHGALTLDCAQISVMYPGYPAYDGSESEAAHRYRKFRCAAHVDGLLPNGPHRRRHIQEPHQFVLGVPLVKSSEQASPMVVWDGSHHIIRAAFKSLLDRVPVQDWSEIDMTEVYHQARKNCFEKCTRVTVLAAPGECYLLHRLALHGIAPWGDEAIAPKVGRMVAYFRPKKDGNLHEWLNGEY